MLTFTSLGKSFLRVTGGPQTLTIFPAEGSAPEKSGLTLLPAPQEDMPSTVISWPGEYSEGGIAIRGVGHIEGRQVSYVAEIDDIRIAFLSSPLQDWSDKELELVGDIDVLVLPTDDVKLVQKLVDEFDPRILIVLPHGTKDDHEVLKAVGAKGEQVSEYKLKGALPSEGREVVVLTKD